MLEKVRNLFKMEFAKCDNNPGEVLAAYKHYQKDECTECFYDVNSGNDLDVHQEQDPLHEDCQGLKCEERSYKANAREVIRVHK